jgi:hypothetical protein
VVEYLCSKCSNPIAAQNKWTNKNRVVIKKIKATNVGKDMGGKEHLYIAGGNINWCSHYKNQCRGSLKN